MVRLISRLTDRLDMTIAVERDVKPKIKPNKIDVIRI